MLYTAAAKSASQWQHCLWLQ